MTNNAKALIKLANVFDLYDHQHYGYRFNKNNPKKSPINIIIQKQEKDQVQEVSDQITNQETQGMPKWVTNKNAPAWSKEQTHIFKRKRSVNGTGGGPAYGVEHRNPFAY